MNILPIPVRRLLALAVSMAGLLLALAAPVDAATASAAGTGLKISPTSNDLTIDKGSSQTVSLSIENETNAPVSVTPVVNDFLPSADEDGVPKLVLGPTQQTPVNDFKSLVAPLSAVDLGARERQTVAVTINVPADAVSGGYYGAVRFTTAAESTSSDVTMTSSLGSIFLVKVPGDLTEKLNVESFGVAHYQQVGPSLDVGPLATVFSGGPLLIQARFHNYGNIHVQPFGKIYIKNSTGKQIETIEFNNTQPRGSVLPDSIRKFEVPIKQQKFFGKYTAEASFGYGTNGDLLLAQKTFYVFPYKLILAIGFIILFMVFVLPRLLRSFQDYRVRRAARKSPKASKPRPQRSRRE